MISDTLNQACATPSEHLALDRAIVKFKRSIMFTYIFARNEVFRCQNLQTLMIQCTHRTQSVLR
jgi:hypothetical protein